MNYQTFLAVKEEKITQGFLNYANNNLYEHIQSPIALDSPAKTAGENNKAYRCHLVEDWLRWCGMDDALKMHIGATSGVRESLRVIAQNGGHWLIPKDVYPVYKTILEPTTHSITEYRTLGEHTLINSLGSGQADTLLLTSPLKPSGIPFSDKEWNHVQQWLGEAPDRKVVIDSVYDLHPTQTSRAAELYAKTNQVILLFSLSKSWILPNHLGIAFLPPTEYGCNLREQMKALPKDEKKLMAAHHALAHHPHFPDVLAEDWRRRARETNLKLGTYFAEDHGAPGYLFYHPKSWDYWLEKGVLTIPSSVFGGDQGVIISTLVDP